MAAPAIPPSAPATIVGLKSDGMPVSSAAALPIAIAQSGLVKLHPPFANNMTTQTAGTSTVSISAFGNPLNQDGSQSAINMTAAAGAQNGCSFTFGVYGRVIGIRFRSNSNTPPLDVVIDGVAYPIDNGGSLYNSISYSAIVEGDEYNVVVSGLPDGRHVVQVCLSCLPAASQTLVFLGYLAESRLYSERMRLADMPTVGTLTTTAAAIPRAVSSVYYRGLWGVVYTNVHASATALVQVKNGATVVWQASLAPKQSATFSLPAPVTLDGSTTTYNHLSDTASAINFGVIQQV